MRELHDSGGYGLPHSAGVAAVGAGAGPRGRRRHGDGSDASVAVVRRAVEAIWNRGELDAADALFAPDYVNHGGLIPDLVRGPEAIKVSVALYRAAFPGLHVAVRRAAGATGRWPCCAGRRTARPRARQAAVPSTAGRGRVTGTTRCRLADGKIAESWTSWDRLGALRRLGLIAP